MDVLCLIYGIEIPNSDWKKTPTSIKELVEKLGQLIKQSEKELAEKESQNLELLEKINRTSNNSSSPPSADPPSAQKPNQKKKSSKKRGGQPGHKGHSRLLYEPEDCTSVLDHHPETCRCCGEKLTGVDAFPYRHQVVDIPPIKPIVVEHRLHQLVCEICGALLKLEEELFKLWYQVRDGTLSRCEFQLKVQFIRDSIKSCLLEAANYEVGYKEKTPFAISREVLNPRKSVAFSTG
jgi:transposase